MAAAVFVVSDRHRQTNKHCSSPDHSVKTPSLKSKLSGIHFGWKEGRASTSTADTAESSMRSGSSEDNSLNRISPISTNTSASTHRTKGVTELHFVPKALPPTPQRSVTLPIPKRPQEPESLPELDGERPPSAMSGRGPSTRTSTITERNSQRDSEGGVLRHWQFHYNNDRRGSGSSERTVETRGTGACSPFSRPMKATDSRTSTPPSGNRIQEMEESDSELTPRRAMKQLPAMISSLGIHVRGGLLPDTASSIYTEVGPYDRHYNRSDYAWNNEDGQRQPSHHRLHQESRQSSHQPLNRKNSWEDSRPSSRDRPPALGKPVRGSTLTQAQLRQDLAQVKEKLSGISDQLFELQRKKAALEAEQELWQRHRIMIEEQLL